jgi:hypothetical protein
LFVAEDKKKTEKSTGCSFVDRYVEELDTITVNEFFCHFSEAFDVAGLIVVENDPLQHFPSQTKTNEQHRRHLVAIQ